MLSQLPRQGPRYYHVSAVLLMLSHGICAVSDLGLGFRCTGRYPPNLFEVPLDAIAAALPEHLGKAAVNEWVGSIQIEPYRYVVHTGTRADPPLTHGPCLLKEAPNGYVDWCQRQEVRGVTSMRCWANALRFRTALRQCASPAIRAARGPKA